MKPRASKLVGTLFVTIAVFTLVFRVLGGDELTLLPWPVSLIVIAIGVFFLKHGGGVEGWAGQTRKGARSS